MSYEYIGCLDFEANCIENKVIYPQEIIEFPVIVYNTQTDQIDRSRDFHYYCKSHVPLTEFCTQLTGITQSMVDTGLDFKEVLDRFDTWMYSNGFTNQNFLLCTAGDWDLKTVLPNYLTYLGLKSKPYFKTWCNAKVFHVSISGQKTNGMNNFMNSYGLEFHGRQHSGIDDAFNLARIVQKMYQSGHELKPSVQLE